MVAGLYHHSGGARPYRIRDIDGRRERAEDRYVLAHVLSAALLGVEAVLVRVEVDVATGLPAFTAVGRIYRHGQEGQSEEGGPRGSSLPRGADSERPCPICHRMPERSTTC